MKEYLKKKPVNPEPLLKYHIQQKTYLSSELV